jgi:hypothetical protein
MSDDGYDVTPLARHWGRATEVVRTHDHVKGSS